MKGWRLGSALVLVVTACGAREKTDDRATGGQPVRAQPAVAASLPTVVFVGTSLTAGLGISPERAYPAVVGLLAEADGLPVRVVNSGASGETSAGALRRIEWVLRDTADMFVVETGANDGLRALDVEDTRRNITGIVRRIQRAQPRARILVVQMEAPPNFGPEYTRRFREIYPAVARETGVGLVPFLLEGVATVPELNQADGIHPNVAGAERVAATVWRVLKPVIEEVLRERN